MKKSDVGDALSEKLKGISEKAITVSKTPDPVTPKGEACCIPSSPDEYYRKPELYLDSKDFPGVRGFTGGEDIYMAIKAKVTSYRDSSSVDENGKKTERCSVELEILEIADITDIKGAKK